jgi:hypothetical protein
VRQRHRYHIAEMNRAACRVHALPVNPDVTSRRKIRSGRSGAHDPCVPQPSVDALALRHRGCFNP